MATAPEQQAPAWWKPVWELVVEVWIGSLLFAIIFAPAVGLDLTVTWLKTSAEVSDFLAALLTWTKYVIAVLDSLLYIVFMANMAWRFVSQFRWKKVIHD
jgi:hypothetical protein